VKGVILFFLLVFVSSSFVSADLVLENLSPASGSIASTTPIISFDIVDDCLGSGDCGVIEDDYRIVIRRSQDNDVLHRDIVISNYCTSSNVLNGFHITCDTSTIQDFHFDNCHGLNAEDPIQIMVTNRDLSGSSFSFNDWYINTAESPELNDPVFISEKISSHDAFFQWYVDNFNEAVLTYSSDGGLISTVQDSSSDYYNAYFNIDDLAPETIYDYQVTFTDRCGNNKEQTGMFTTKSELFITDISGDFSKGNTMSILGRGLGIKDPVEPYLWDSISNQDAYSSYSHGEVIPVFADLDCPNCPWANTGADDILFYDHGSELRYPGAIHYQGDKSGVVTGFDDLDISGDGGEIYVSWWLRNTHHLRGHTVINCSGEEQFRWFSTKLLRTWGADEGGNYADISYWRTSWQPYQMLNYYWNGANEEIDYDTHDSLQFTTNVWHRNEAYILNEAYPGWGEYWWLLDGKIISHAIDRINWHPDTGWGPHDYIRLLGVDVLTDCNGVNDESKFWFGDIYVDTSLARIEVCNVSDWNESIEKHCEVQIPRDVWDDDAINFSVNTGSFSDEEIEGGLYLFVINEHGAVSDGFFVRSDVSCTVSDECSFFDDGPCIEGLCEDNICVRTYPANVCDDGDVCTTNICDQGSCEFSGFTSVSCDDGVVCTTTSVCNQGSCVGDDLDHDLCSPVSGCNVASCSVDGCVSSDCSIPESLLLWYDFEYGSFADVSFFDHVGVVSGDVSFVDGSFGDGVLFDDGMIVASDDVDLSGLSAVTVSSWVNIPSWPVSLCGDSNNFYCRWHIVGKSGRDSDLEYRLRYFFDGSVDDLFLWQLSDGVVSSEVSFVADFVGIGEWHHVVGSWDGLTSKIFLDGVLMDSVSFVSDSLFSGPASFSVGSSGDGSNSDDFVGSVDEVMVFDYALSDDEVSDLFLGVLPGENSVISYDLDGINGVGIGDLLLLVEFFGSSYSVADFNGDGVVNVLDVVILINHFD